MTAFLTSPAKQLLFSTGGALTAQRRDRQGGNTQFHCCVKRRASWLVASQTSPISSASEGNHQHSFNDDCDPLNHSIDSLLQKLRSAPKTGTGTGTGTGTEAGAEASSSKEKSTIYLIGTGPGDPGLLTVRALQLMQRATVVLYDRLVSDEIVSLINNEARLVYVGKESGFHTRSQEEIHMLLDFFATASVGSGTEPQVVVRLKGGDPFIFGRGGEEVEFLTSVGLNVVTIPGITAASGIAAQLGLPLTMRGYSTSVQYLTGHVTTGFNKHFGTLDNHTTYVVYMGLAQLDVLASQLVDNGLDPTTPSVVVQQGTTPQQRVIADRLCDIAPRVTAAKFVSPTLIIVGAVVALSWCWSEERRGRVTEGLFPTPELPQLVLGNGQERQQTQHNLYNPL